MLRLIWLILLVAAVLVAFNAVLQTMQAVNSATTSSQEDRMPTAFQKVAYLLLIVLMLGVTTGWLGAG